ncbi:MAG: bifunctional adenosylcobinamide kinase/adenosylcobinamide-phosphate guanylyltransferase [Gammaproteobacteria bacterium]|nr:bifunctional adenosylcobinamide kinase/adenosylcobinamide-phosphate guanylyltransferase [Gammaproteobacteria bacterium]
MKELILGGARSGKSRTAEQHAIDSGKQVIYIATATAGDDEMAQRIEHHQQQRPDHWRLIEEPFALTQTLQQQAAEDHCILVDCLTLWLTNMLINKESELALSVFELVEVLPMLPGDIIFVSNEVGNGIVPADPLSRRFCDEAGRLHQNLAQVCDRVTLVIAGLEQSLK